MGIRTVFGLNLRRLRLSERLTQEAAGDLMQLERAHFGRIEQGKQNVSIDTIERICRVLNCEWADLFDKEAAADFGDTYKSRPTRVVKARKPRRSRKPRRAGR